MTNRSNFFAKLFVTLWLFITSLISISVLKGGLGVIDSNFFWELFKFVGGPLIGAGIAFYVNDHIHRERKETEEKSALFGAAFAIGAMYDDFVNYRLATRETLAQVDKHNADKPPPIPIWVYARPHLFTFNSSAGPNLSSLQFLLHLKEGRIAYQNIQVLQRSYNNLHEAHQLFNSTASEMQEKLSDAQGRQTTTTESEDQSIEDLLGIKLAATVLSVTVGVVDRIEKDDAIYQRAFDSLVDASKIYFKKNVGLKSVTINNEKFKKQNLPPLPQAFVDQLKKK